MKNGKITKILPICECRECNHYHSWPFTVMIQKPNGKEKRVVLWGKRCEFAPADIECKGVCLEGLPCEENKLWCQKKGVMI